MCSFGIDVIKIALSGKRGHFIRYHFQSTPRVHASSYLCIGTCQSWRAKLVKIIRLRFQITLDINGLALLLFVPIEARDKRVVIYRSAHSRALREANALRGSMELWEIHPRWQT